METIQRVYLIGIGGIGMSALARFFKQLGKAVSGYDRTATKLTKTLVSEGMPVHYADDLSLVPSGYLDASNKDTTLIIYTPAIPADHSELSYFRNNDFTLLKRARVLGMITESYSGIAVAGSHGKSTISSLLATIFHGSPQGCSAFLGAISKNFNSNLVANPDSRWAVMEADEFDRSFLQLEPSMALITSIDPDHLDIYSGADYLQKSFEEFLGKLRPGSAAVIKKGLSLAVPDHLNLQLYTYGFDSSADFYPVAIRQNGLGYQFSLKHPQGMMENLQLRIPGWINVENATGAAAISWLAGISDTHIRQGMLEFAGVKRRFDIRFHRSGKLYLDDYAHHPREIHALIDSVRKLFPGGRILGIFQPHLFSRTRDFADEFAKELEALDELMVMDIYPAREAPMEGVSSLLITEKIKRMEARIFDREDIVEEIIRRKWDVLLTIGAGDIDLLVEPIENALNEVYH